MPFCKTPTPSTPVSINAIASDTHVKWLRERDRSYSPYNKPWIELDAEQRREASRQVANVIESLWSAGVKIGYVDEYVNPSPSEHGFVDPERTPGKTR